MVANEKVPADFHEPQFKLCDSLTVPKHTGCGDQEQCRATHFKPNRSSACELASSLYHVVKSKLRIPHNLAEDSFAQIAFAMNGDSGPAPVGMNEDRMASRLAVEGKAALIENGNDLAGIEGRKLWTHTATRTLWEPTSS